MVSSFLPRFVIMLFDVSRSRRTNTELTSTWQMISPSPHPHSNRWWLTHAFCYVAMFWCFPIHLTTEFTDSVLKLPLFLFHAQHSNNTHWNSLDLLSYRRFTAMPARHALVIDTDDEILWRENCIFFSRSRSSSDTQHTWSLATSFYSD